MGIKVKEYVKGKCLFIYIFPSIYKIDLLANHQLTYVPTLLIRKKICFQIIQAVIKNFKPNSIDFFLFSGKLFVNSIILFFTGVYFCLI